MVCYFLLIFLFHRIQINANPRVFVSPKKVKAGTFQKLLFTFDPDTVKIEPGGGIRIELPVAYLETEKYYWDTPQNNLPHGPGFVVANSNNHSDLSVNIYGHKNRIIQATLTGNSEKINQKIFLKYSGMVQSIVWPLSIRAQWRKTQKADWHDISPYPSLEIEPREAYKLVIINPADVTLNKIFNMKVILLDRFGNQAINYRGKVTFNSTDPQANFPDNYTFTAQDSGIHIFKNIKYNTYGFQKITATDGKLNGRSNYSEVTIKEPEYKRYFGDTHFHTGIGMNNKGFTKRGAGGDHRGHFTTEDWAYHYARDVINLDFASASEHDAKIFKGKLWEKSQKITDSYYIPGEFTTFFAYEWTASPRIGHNVIIYKDRKGKVLNHFEYPTKTALWKAFDEQDVPVIMIPHPMWTQPDHKMWNKVNNKYRTIGEIYSLWCTRFLLQPAVDAQRFELGINDPWSFQYAWAKRHKIGVIGSSDNHTAHPGLNNYSTDMVHSSGLAVVLASKNNRENIWDALQNRRTYATTGTRILVRFSSNGHPMGSEYITSSAPNFNGKVAGSNQLKTVELVKFSDNKYKVIYKVTPESDTAKFNYTDNNFSEDSMYYLRVKQVNEIWKSPWSYGTAEMAWSSPIWINFKNK